MYYSTNLCNLHTFLYSGTLHSPQLLMLSGVGPKDHLNSLKIDVIEDLPVGYNLHDHVSMSALTFLVNESVTIVEPRLASNLVNTLNYFVEGTGPLTVPGGAECLAFINTKDQPKRNSPTKHRVCDDKKSRGYAYNQGNASFIKITLVTTIFHKQDIFAF